MAMYLTRFSYTPETWARMIENPEDRRKAASAYIKSAGGKLHGFWYAFGGHDGWNLWEAPDNVSMASVVLAIGAGGALSKCETTVLLSVEETIEALGNIGRRQHKKSQPEAFLAKQDSELTPRGGERTRSAVCSAVEVERCGGAQCLGIEG